MKPLLTWGGGRLCYLQWHKSIVRPLFIGVDKRRVLIGGYMRGLFKWLWDFGPTDPSKSILDDVKGINHLVPKLLAIIVCLIGIMLACVFCAFFYVVPEALVVFPKEQPSFANTFVDVKAVVKRLNEANFFERIILEHNYLVKELRKRKFIVENQDEEKPRKRKGNHVSATPDPDDPSKMIMHRE
ncbi:MAG: hypothetical protein WC859_00815 [Elusimicrobiota bacterium]